MLKLLVLSAVISGVVGVNNGLAITPQMGWVSGFFCVRVRRLDVDLLL